MRLLFDHYKHKLGIHGSSPIVIQEDEQEPGGSGDGKKKGKIWDWIRSSDSELVADGEDEGDEVVFQNVYAAFQDRSSSAPAGPSGSSPATHILVSSPTMSQVEDDYVDDNSDENDETYVDVEPDEE
ncbi:unnamed protein product [Linum trigynum]|uniref:Uncharacterized protein n=1 Tax=Linum trigynum TaxID=586398 RepID=A0AAV2E504_9ROSI